MATIYDVAKLAGVSPKTVSRVLNNDAPVRPTTRKAVEQAIAELGYIPLSAARAMRSHRSGLVGLITGAISRAPGHSELRGLPDMYLVQGAQQAAAETSKTLVIADTGDKPERINQLFRTFRQHRVEGIVYVAEFHQEVDLPVMPDDCPLVLLNCFDRKNTPAVIPDDEYGQRVLVEQIITHGHRRIAYLSLQPNAVATYLRTMGYRKALLQAGIDYDAALVETGYTDLRNDSSDLWCALDRLLALAQPPTVICCGNDEMALRVYGILRTRGIRVPQDIAVAGFDNYRAITETLFPPLSSAELPYTQMGAQAVKILVDMIEHNRMPEPNPVLVRGDVVWRSSVLPLRQELQIYS
ncbi:MAG: LacI family DNA-binding transcriptional regulator [Neisseria sp.]|uniref:LacI family DNA-binding transcriptional regulator n=1 Tax=Neisseria sp. TaxID=192066 RepID=UPI0026DB15B0|nr:LacI family DNA-binding transcriptional regulator [Neisseria sp.]MDO4247659.1 LacI family DNA-binding transcriptional regulator [Neisseria sp.]